MALIVVLIVIMAITVLSMGFLSRSDVELACGENMILKTQMDYLAESALEHAKGLILNPQNVASEYWAGAEDQQLIAGSDDYYDVNVAKLGELNYRITSTAHREKGGEQIGSSSLTAELRLDPVIAFWTGASTTISSQITINGDVFCNNDLINTGTINGDVFAASLSGVATGQLYPVDQADVNWPNISVSDFESSYYIDSTSYTPETLALDDYNNISLPTSLINNPKGVVFYNDSPLTLSGNVSVNGTLVVNGDLIITGANNTIVAYKSFPALVVNGQLRIEQSGQLTINGLAQVESMFVGGDAADITMLGALFVNSGLNVSPMYSGNINITAVPNKAAIEIWPEPGTAQRWSPAAGAFFKGIERQ
jgi:cytoskeletal protein CcmA (bactofilin family)